MQEPFLGCFIAAGVDPEDAPEAINKSV